MKKALYALLAIVIIGGVAFGVSNTDLLKGNVKTPDIATTEIEEGDQDDEDGSGLSFEEGTDGTVIPGGKDLPGGTIDIPAPGGGGGGGGGTTDCDSSYFLSIAVQDVAENDMRDLDMDDFTIKNSSGSDVTSSFSLDDGNSYYGNYDLEYNGSSAASSYDVTVNPSGFKEGTTEISTNDSCGHYFTGRLLTLDYNHSITVYDHDGNETGNATVKTGTSYATSCDYWSSQDKYVCETPDSSTEQYRVSMTGYVTKEGSFTSGSGASASVGWAGTAGLGTTYEVEDLGDIWGTTQIEWSKEDLMGIEIDPSDMMEYIPKDWDYDQYTDPDYWTDANVFTDRFFDTGSEADYYTEALDFYGSALKGTDLSQFKTNAGYHDFLINSYVNTYQATPAYQSAMAESYAQGAVDYSSYANMAQYSSYYQNYTSNYSYRTTFKRFNPAIGLTSLLAASGKAYSTTSGVSSAASAVDVSTTAASTATSAYSSSSYSTEYTDADGEESTHKDVTLNQFAWSFAIYDETSGDAIEDASVTITAGSSTSDCDHEENGIYWCSETSYYSSSGSKPSYTIAATGYDSESGNYSESRTKQTSDPVVEVIYLTQTDTTDPASYCDTLDLSSGDTPIAWDATEVGEIQIDIELLAFSEDYEDLLTIETSGDGAFNGDTLSGISELVSGSSTHLSYTYEGGAVGDTLTASVYGEACTDSTLTIEQDTEPEGDEEYELACSSADITPDSYEIYLSAPTDYQHAFTLEWTTAEQLIAIRNAPEWIKSAFAVKNDINPFLHLAEENDGEITFTVSTTGNGNLYYYEDTITAYDELTYSSSEAETDTVTFYYSYADGGDAIYITSSDNNCSDSLTLTEEEAEEEEEDDDEEEEIDFEEIEDIDSCDEYPFTDVDDDDDMASYIFCLAQTGAVQGYGDGSYGPGNNITNAELIKIIVAMTGEPLASSSDPTDFIDITDHWAERYIKTAEALDIARPRENVYFSPDSPATRGYLITLLARGAEKTLWGWDSSDIEATDVSTSDYFAYALILAMDAYGDVPGIGEEAIVQGYSDGSFKGEYNIRRDEAAAMLIRAFYAWYL